MTVHRILADPLCRRAVRCLRVIDGPVTFDELVTRLRDGESVDRDDVALRLYHNHLPKLEEGGAIEFDRGTDRIRLTSRGVAVARVDRLTREFLESRNDG
ncbi:MAG: hypothetical protein ABEJ89_06340 [Haloarculaceae archaeon]